MEGGHTVPNRCYLGNLSKRLSSGQVFPGKENTKKKKNDGDDDSNNSNSNNTDDRVLCPCEEPTDTIFQF